MEAVRAITKACPGFIPAWAWLVLSACALAGGIILLIFGERGRMDAAEAKAKLKRFTSEEPISETYDIKSYKNIEHREYEETRKTAQKNIPCTLMSATGLFLGIAAMCVTVSMLATLWTAHTHGYRDGFNVNAASLWEDIDLSPVEDTLPDDLEGTLVICYRFGCPDCEAVWPELSKLFGNDENIYWIASRSEQGKAFCEEHNITDVPCAVYTAKDGRVLSWTLYMKENGETKADPNALAEIQSAMQWDSEH